MLVNPGSKGRVSLVAFLVLVQQTLSFQPHILFIVADDYGWKDVGYHGSDIRTPYIDKLASEGVELNQHYVQALCTPTRSAMLTGMFPIHTGLQVSTISPALPYGMNVGLTTLPAELSKVGYATYGVGKWHLGYCRKAYLPTSRGFDSFYGFWNGAIHYFTHMRACGPSRCSSNFSSGLDYFDDVTPLPEKKGAYSAFDFAEKAGEIVKTHVSQSEGLPLFLYLSFASVHSPYQVPDVYRNRFPEIRNPDRKTYAGMTAALDDAVGYVTSSFSTAGIVDKTLVVFTSDNGGTGPGRNWPLRGRKATLWEGGVRSVAFVRGWGVFSRKTQANALIHAVDWFATLIRVGSNYAHAARVAEGTDSLDQWDFLSGQNTTAPRTHFVINLEPVGKGSDRYSTGGVRFGRFKYLVNAPGGTCDACPQGANCDSWPILPCSGRKKEKKRVLIDLQADPAENFNLYLRPGYDDVVAKGEQLMASYLKSMVPALFNICEMEIAANPANSDFIWPNGWCEPPYVTNTACGL